MEKKLFKSFKLKGLFLLFSLMLSTHFLFAQTIFYSQGDGDFSSLFNWDTNPTGGAIGPLSTQLTDGLNIFVVQDGHHIVADQDLNVKKIQIGQGAVQATLTIGNSATARNLVLGGLEIATNSVLGVNDFITTHLLTLKGNFVNNGTANFKFGNYKVCNLIFDGTFAVSGSNSPHFNDLKFLTGALTAAVSFDINGNVVIENNADFNDGNLTHTIAGNWTENGTGERLGTGTIVFDGSSIQAIIGTGIFHHLTANGGNTLIINQNTTINGDFLLTNNTIINTAYSHTFKGNFTVTDGSFIDATNGTFTFDATAQTQNLNIGFTGGLSAVWFYRVYFDNGNAAFPKNFNGELRAKTTTYIYPDAVLNGDIARNHDLNDLRIEGQCNLLGTIILRGGTIYDYFQNDIYLNTNLIIQGGVYLNNNDILHLNGDFTLNSNFFVLSDGAKLIGDASKSMLVKEAARLYIRGANNFPTGFASITLHERSYVRYDANINQIIKSGIPYGGLEMYYQTKTAEGNLDINYGVSMYQGTFDMGNYTHTIAGSFANDNTADGIYLSTGTVILDSPDADQYLNASDGGSYVFNNLYFTNPAPTAVREKRIYKNIQVNGNFSITNTGGDAIRYLNVNIYDSEIQGNNGSFTLGSNVRLYTNGSNSFSNTVQSFDLWGGLVQLASTSSVYFNRHLSDQYIPAFGALLAYGNVDFWGDGKKILQGTSLDINGNITRSGYLAIFKDSGKNVNVAGNWNLGLGFTELTGTVIFDGAYQEIGTSNFNHITFAGTNIKKIIGDSYVFGNLTIKGNSTVENPASTIYIQGNWVEEANALFKQPTSWTVFNGTVNQTITAQPASYFGNFRIDKAGVNKTVTANSNFAVKQSFDFIDNNASFNLNGKVLYLGLNWNFRLGCTFAGAGGKIVFNGNDGVQYIRNYNGNIVYPNLEFQNNAFKYLEQDTFYVNGNFVIDKSVVTAGGWHIYVSGNWQNTGTFQHSGHVILTGADQTIGTSQFYNLYIDGSGTKTLAGNIQLNGSLEIRNNVTLDISPNNYTISLQGNWQNDSTGSFVARQGTVVFVGNSSIVWTGKGNKVYGTSLLFLPPKAGLKDFYNLEVSQISGAGLRLRGDLRVENNFIINSGTLWQSENPINFGVNDISVGGDFVNEQYYGYAYEPGILFLNATTGTKRFKPGINSYGHVTINADASVKYILESNFYMENNFDFQLNNATFDLNHYEMRMWGASGFVNLNSGTFEINSGAILRIYSGSRINNNGATFKLVGNETTPATLSISTTGNYDFVQTAGVFHAKYFRVESTRNAGIDIQGGSIDPVNNFSEGTFTSGIGTSYICLNGLDLGAGITPINTGFNIGTTNNVARTSGTGIVNFQNATGSLAGENYDNDPVNIVNWTYPGVYSWTGAGDGTNWDDGANWASGTVPTSSSNVILDHSAVGSAYTVRIQNANAVVNRLTLDIQAGAAISLVLDSKELTIKENLTVNAGATLQQTQSTDTIRIGGNWSNNGTFLSGTATVVFNPLSGTKNIINSVSSPFYNLKVKTEGAVLALASNIEINNDLELAKGVFDASAAYNIYVRGNWLMRGGSFNARTSVVYFDKGGNSTQIIEGGAFHSIIISNKLASGTAIKQIASNISIENDLTIQANSVFDGGQYIVYLKDDLLNYVGDAGFVQTGSGTLVLSGGDQLFTTTGVSTTINHLICAGTGRKEVRTNLNVNGDISITTGSLDIYDGFFVTGMGTNSLIQTGSYIYVRGAANFPQGFENIALNNGYVYYYADVPQTIYPTIYYSLLFGRPTVGVIADKIVTNNLVINGGLTLYDQTFLRVNNYTITLKGGIDFYPLAKQIEWGANGTLIHNGGDWAIDGDITSFNNLFFTGTGTKSFWYRSMKITGDLTVDNECGIQQHDTVKVTCTSPNKTFSLIGQAYYYVYTNNLYSKAFALGFTYYNLDKQSRVYLRGNANQTIFTTPVYGNLYLYTTKIITQTLDGNLKVENDFLMSYNELTLNDAGFNISVGRNFEHRNYIPSPNTTFTFHGENQSIYDYRTGNVDLIFENLVFSGSGIKTIRDGGDFIVVNKNLTIAENVEVFTDRVYTMKGQAWTDNGKFNQTSNWVEFTSNSPQTIEPSQIHQFYGMKFSGTGLKTVQEYGLNSYNGVFEIAVGSTLQLGNLTHRLATIRPLINGTWITNNANFVLYRAETQYIPALTCNNITFGNGDINIRNRYLEGNLVCNDLLIEDKAQLVASIDNLTTSPKYSITLSGNWTDLGRFYAYGNTVNFESNNTDAKTIKLSQYGYFFNLNFNQSNTNARNYTVNGEMRVLEVLRIGNGASVNMAGQNLYLGDDDTNAPAAEQHFIDVGGELKLSAAGSLLFNTDDAGNPKLTVNGTLELIGSVGNYVNINKNGGGNYIDILISNLGKIKAKYYHFQYISPNGFEVMNGATIDPVNNFSEGTWSNMHPNASLGKCYYLKINNDVSTLPAIENVTFNFNGTPTSAIHYNVFRSSSATGVLTFAGDINGVLGGKIYEDDAFEISNGAPGKIVWPPISAVAWNGSVSIDWFNPNNWTPAIVPDISIQATIPIQANNPVIYNANAACKDLIISNGFLTLDEAKSLRIANSVTIGNAAEVAILSVNNPLCNIEVGGDWNRGANAVFNHGNGTVRFTKEIGSNVISPRNSPFYNVIFVGGATYYWSGAETFVHGNFILSAGIFSPSTDWYLLHLRGNYNNTGGQYFFNRAGTLILDGSNQDITKGTFNRLEVSGSGIKTFSDSLYLNLSNGLLTVKSTMKAAPNCTMDINSSDVIIENTGTFDDGNETHYFGGYRWYGNGNYAGNGTIVFDRPDWQYIYSGTFYNLTFEQNWRALGGNISVLNNFYNKGYFQTQTFLMTNPTGNGIFTLTDNSRVYVLGANNHPTGFGSYQISPISNSYYEGYLNQTIKGNIPYGNLNLSHGTKSLGGDVDINGQLYLYSDAIFDVSTNNYKINISGAWNNSVGGEFVCRQGEVVLDGTTSRDITLKEGAKNDFYKLTVNLTNPTTYWRVLYADISIKDNLRVLGGRFSAYNRIIDVYGDMTAIGGTFTTEGTYRLVKPSGTASIKMNGSILNNLYISSSATYTLQDDLALNGNFMLTSATFDANGKQVRLGYDYDIISISGTYKMGVGGRLSIGNGSTLTVNNGGIFYAVGAENQPAIVTNYGGRYNFSVESGGTIHAKYHWFEFMNTGGIYVKQGALIDNTNNFSYGVFTNCPSGGYALRIENNQSFTEALGNRIVDLSFPVNPSNGAANVAKFENTSGIIEIYHSVGSFSGETFDYDPQNLIIWTGETVLTWVGTINSNWHNAANWRASIGADIVPTRNEDVVIADATNQPIISQSKAYAKSIVMNPNTYLTLNIQNAADTSLQIMKDLVIKGNLIMQSDKDILTVGGNWINTGTFSGGEGLVIFKPQQNLITVDNYTSMFSNLAIDGIGTVSLNRNAIVSNNLEIRNGIFDVTTNNYTLAVGGDFLNLATFNPRAGRLTLNSTRVGDVVFNPGNAIYNYIDIEAGNASVYKLTTSDLRMTRSMNINSGIFDLNKKTFFFGDAISTDIITVVGILKISGGSSLKMANTSKMIVANGGQLNLVGEENLYSTINNQGTGYYGVEINSGGLLSAKYYNISNINGIGIWLKSGSLLNATHNLSFGNFLYCETNGRYLLMENDLPLNTQIQFVDFGQGAKYNVKRPSGANFVTFVDAFGLRGGYLFEEDDFSANLGNVRWEFTDPTLFWTGNVDEKWDDLNNWDDGAGGTGVPNHLTRVFIPNVTATTGNYPIINQSNATTRSVTIYTGGRLELQANLSLRIAENFENSGNFSIQNTSLSTVEVGKQWVCTGTFSSGTNSTVIFQALSGAVSITTNGQPFNNVSFTTASNAEYKTVDAFTAKKNFEIMQGSFTVTNSAHTITVGSNWNNQATYNHGNADLVFNGNNNQNITNTGTGRFFNVFFAGSGTKTLYSDIYVEGNLEILSTLNAKNKTIRLLKNWKNSGTFIPETSTIMLLGSEMQLVEKLSGETFYNLTINNTASSVPQVLFNGNVLVKNGTFALIDGVVETSSSNLLTLENASLSGGTTTASYITGPMRKIGSANFVFPIGKGSKFAPIAISGMISSASFTAEYFEASPVNTGAVTGALTHVSGKEHWFLNRESGTGEPQVTLYWNNGPNSGIDNLDELTVAAYNGSVWNEFGSSIIGSLLSGAVRSISPATYFGYFTFGSLSADYNPFSSGTQWLGSISSAWEILANWSNGIPNQLNNATITAAPINQPVISSAAVCKSLTIHTGAKLVVTEGYSLTAHSGTYNNGELLLKSPINSGAAASFIDNGTVEGAGQYIIERFFSRDEWHYLSTPVNYGNASSYLFTNPFGTSFYNSNFITYNEPSSSNSWMNGWVKGYTNETTPKNLEIMKGYAFISNQYHNILFAGTFNTGEQTRLTTYTNGTEIAAHEGWNLVGNPYPSAIDWNAAGWDKQNIDNTIYFWDGNNYSYYVGTGGSAGVGINNGTNIIPAMQGFMVKASNNGHLRVNNLARTHNNSVIYYKSGNNDEFLKLSCQNQNTKDELIVRFNDEASNEYDGGFDAYKLFADKEGVPQIFTYSKSGETKLAINTLTNIADNYHVAMDFNSLTAGQYTIDADQISIDLKYPVLLEDLLENKLTDLRKDGSYTFSYDPSIAKTPRFVIHFTTDLEDDGFDEENLAQIQVSAFKNNVTVKLSNTYDFSGKIEIVDMLGKVLITKMIDQNVTEFNLEAANGVYIVKVQSNEKTISKRVLIQE